MTQAYRLLAAPSKDPTPNVPVLRAAVSVPMKQIRHGLATGLRRLARWIEAR
jgi:hypothetical protein